MQFLATPRILSAPMIDLPIHGFSRHAITGLCRLISRVGLGGRHFVGTGAYEPSRVKFDGNPLTGDQQRFEAIHAAIAANPVVTIGRPTFGWLDAAFQSLLVLHNLSEISLYLSNPAVYGDGRYRRFGDRANSDECRSAELRTGSDRRCTARNSA